MLLFFPIYTKTTIYYDADGRKCGFAVYLYKFLFLGGGYIATYPGGLALHISKKKAILLPFREIEAERKRVSWLKSLRLQSLEIHVETGAEYLLWSMLGEEVLCRVQAAISGNKARFSRGLWLANGEIFRITAAIHTKLTGYRVLKTAMKSWKEHVLCQTKTKKSSR